MVVAVAVPFVLLFNYEGTVVVASPLVLFFDNEGTVVVVAVPLVLFFNNEGTVVVVAVSIVFLAAKIQRNLKQNIRGKILIFLFKLFAQLTLSSYL